MRNTLLILVAGLAIIALFSLYSREAHMNIKEPSLDDVANNFIIKEAKILEKKYAMRLSGIGGREKNGRIWVMNASFDRDDSLISESEARWLIISCVNDYLEAVNRDESVRPYLLNYPFTYKNLTISIHHMQKDGHVAYYPYISLVNISNGKIGIFTDDPADRYKYKTEKYEPFEEALAIVENEKKSPNPQ